MTKRSVALVGVLIVMVMVGSTVIGAVSAIATSDAANGSYSIFFPLIMNAIGEMAEVPQGAVMTFNLTSCPSGWTEVVAAKGKVIVGLQTGGTLQGVVGLGLGDLEDRNHSHDVNPVNTQTNSVADHRHSVPGSNWTAFTSDTGGHSHGVNIPVTDTSSYSSTSKQVLGMTDLFAYIVDDSSHEHSVNIGTVISSFGGTHAHDVWINPNHSGYAGTHSHSVDLPNTPSTTASTSDVMPYIQFLVCEKD